MALEPGAFVNVFSGNRVHVEGPGSGPVVVASSSDVNAPNAAQVAFVVKQLAAARVKIEHAGWNPVPWVRKFRPQTQEEAIALLGLAHDLMDPELSPTDLENLSRDVIRENKVAKFFMFV